MDKTRRECFEISHAGLTQALSMTLVSLVNGAITEVRTLCIALHTRAEFRLQLSSCMKHLQGQRSAIRSATTENSSLHM